MRMRREEVEAESEMSEEAYELASPATTQSMSLHPVSPSEGESEVEGAGISTRKTTPGPDGTSCLFLWCVGSFGPPIVFVRVLTPFQPPPANSTLIHLLSVTISR